MTIRCLVIDDEPLGRDRIKSLLRAIPDVELAGECETGAQAVQSIVELKPDLLFLDVQMPELDGFAVLAALDTDLVPAVVFVTAYDEYALKAFEVHAQDYLLKPVDADRFREAVQRVVARLHAERTSATNTRLLALLEQIERERPRATRLPVHSGERVFFVPVDEIDWLEAADNYVRIHAQGDTHLVRKTLQHMEQTLSPHAFVRVHRSAIVNVGRIREIQPWVGGEYVILLRDGSKVHTGRRYRARLEALIS
jgi:two-component system LytT family response regulator